MVGGSSGIGAGIAMAFVRTGAAVQVTGAPPGNVQGAAADEEPRGIRCVAPHRITDSPAASLDDQ